MKQTPNVETLKAFEDAAELVKAANLEPADTAPAVAVEEQDTSWMDAPVLDKSKPYGEVANEPPKRFWQNGKYFDYAGNLIK